MTGLDLLISVLAAGFFLPLIILSIGAAVANIRRAGRPDPPPEPTDTEV
jgi:hypothetical protein